MTELPPGAWSRTSERWGRFDVLSRALPADALVLADRRVLSLHGHLRRALAGRRVIALPAGERTKSIAMVQRLALETLDVSRRTTVLAIGGGTIGDLAAVFAHLLKRGVRLVHCPTTLLAAVDSSVGGKGAVNVGGVKNALGVFHVAEETWLCSELFETLTEAQRREGRIEAWKVALTDEGAWRRWCASPPEDARLIEEARALKEAVVARDPYERRGVRSMLNFGHTFGHVIEGLTGYRVRHGVAVGLGVLCALDVGRALKVTPPALAEEVERAMPGANGARRRLAEALRGASVVEIERRLGADKKGGGRGFVTMVLLARPGRIVERVVKTSTWRALLPAWRA